MVAEMTWNEMVSVSGLLAFRKRKSDFSLKILPFWLPSKCPFHFLLLY